MKTVSNVRTLKMVQLALLTAIIILMAFTPIGYIKVAGLPITLIGIPVIIGAITLGPKAGAILGAVFGLTSFSQAFGFDAFGTLLFGINPIATFVTCMLPRILMGWLTGLIFQALKKIDKTKFLSYVITSISGALLNTVLFMGVLMMFFYNLEEFQEIVAAYNVTNVFALIIAMAGINAVAEAITCGILGTTIAKPVDILNKRNGMD